MYVCILVHTYNHLHIHIDGMHMDISHRSGEQETKIVLKDQKFLLNFTDSNNCLRRDQLHNVWAWLGLKDTSFLVVLDHLANLENSSPSNIHCRKGSDGV
jgi:hypothetical protein